MKAYPAGLQDRPKDKVPHHLRMYATHRHEMEDMRPRRPCRGSLTGSAAAMEEYRYFKAAGMLSEWRARWKSVLPSSRR